MQKYISIDSSNDKTNIKIQDNSIILSVKDGIERINPQRGSITFNADQIQLGETSTIRCGNQTLETFVTNKLDGYIKKSDVSSAAKTAIAEINASEDIAGVQAAMVKFLQTLVIP